MLPCIPLKKHAINKNDHTCTENGTSHVARHSSSKSVRPSILRSLATSATTDMQNHYSAVQLAESTLKQQTHPETIEITIKKGYHPETIEITTKQVKESQWNYMSSLLHLISLFQEKIDTGNQ